MTAGVTIASLENPSVNAKDLNFSITSGVGVADRPKSNIIMINKHIFNE